MLGETGRSTSIRPCGENLILGAAAWRENALGELALRAALRAVRAPRPRHYDRLKELWRAGPVGLWDTRPLTC